MRCSYSDVDSSWAQIKMGGYKRISDIFLSYIPVRHIRQHNFPHELFWAEKFDVPKSRGQLPDNSLFILFRFSEMLKKALI